MKDGRTNSPNWSILRHFEELKFEFILQVFQMQVDTYINYINIERGCGPAISGVSLKDVPMANFHVKARFRKSLLDFFSHHHRAVLPAGASKRYRQVALALANVVRQ